MPSKEKLWDYFILSARVLLALVFLSYGWGKVIGDQFGLRPEELNTPVKDLSLFRLSWYLFDHEPFKSFVGVFQIIAGLLLLYNRTLILGALLAIPILVNILVIDITYLKMTAFYWRLSYYMVLDFIILWHYRDRMFAAFKNVTSGISTKFKYRWWAYLILPVAAFCLDFLGGLIKTGYYLIVYPTTTLNGLKNMPAGIMEFVRKLFG